MRKISAMYQWSGGTDYRHTCYERKNCVRTDQRKSIYKCLSYGNTESSETDWKASYIACKAFDKEPPEIPVFETKHKTAAVLDGQMSLFDFMDCMEEKI